MDIDHSISDVLRQLPFHLEDVDWAKLDEETKKKVEVYILATIATELYRLRDSLRNLRLGV